MQRIIKLSFLFLLAFPGILAAQNYVNVPYSRYALGDLINSGFSYNKAMGGSSIALRPANQVNYMNPASYTAQDTMSFLFLAGINGRSSTLTAGESNDRSMNMNINYLAMGFPIARFVKFSMGIAPFNRIQYLFEDYLDDDESVVLNYAGDGGYNEFYFGTAIQFADFLSAGVNANYVFGSMNRNTSIDVSNRTSASTRVNENYMASDFYFRLGLQAHPSFTDKKDRKHTLTLGAIYDFDTDIKINYEAMISRQFPSGFLPTQAQVDTFNLENDSVLYMHLPQKLALGCPIIFTTALLSL